MRINPGKDLTIHGNLKAQGEENNMFWITSNAGFENDEFLMFNSKLKEKHNSTFKTQYSKLGSNISEHLSHSKFKINNSKLQRSEPALYNSMELSSLATVEDDLIEWGKWDWGGISLLNKTNDINVRNSIFRNSRSGFYTTDTDSVYISNLLSVNCNSENEAGIFCNNVTKGNIENNIIKDCIN